MLNYRKGNEFDLHKNTELIVHLNGCALGLALRLRHAGSNSGMGYCLKCRAQFHFKVSFLPVVSVSSSRG